MQLHLQIKFYPDNGEQYVYVRYRRVCSIYYDIRIHLVVVSPFFSENTWINLSEKNLCFFIIACVLYGNSSCDGAEIIQWYTKALIVVIQHLNRLYLFLAILPFIFLHKNSSCACYNVWKSGGWFNIFCADYICCTDFILDQIIPFICTKRTKAIFCICLAQFN